MCISKPQILNVLELRYFECMYIEKGKSNLFELAFCNWIGIKKSDAKELDNSNSFIWELNYTNSIELDVYKVDNIANNVIFV